MLIPCVILSACGKNTMHESEPGLMWGRGGGSKDCFGNLTMNVSVKFQGWWQDGVSTQPHQYNRI